MAGRQSTRREKGFSLLVGAISLLFIMPMVGLLVDVGVLYSVKARLQASVDGASLAAARALNLGQSTAQQTVSAQQNAVNWFYANFPGGNWGTTNTQMSQATVSVFDDPNNPHLRNITVNATTTVPTYFLGWLHVYATTISASGNASRRDVVVMMVLDRSGSMNNGTSPSACQSMVTAAKLFTGQFAAGRDQIGLVSFSDSVYVHSVPTTAFQTTLGYSNYSGSAAGAIDTISCGGGTGTAEAISVAYNMLYQMNLPGALNLIMFETDGLPNTLTMNFWDSSLNQAGLKTTSACKDKNNTTMSGGGFASGAVLPSWTAGESLGSGSFYSNLPAGMVAAVASTDPGESPGFFLMLNYWSTTTANHFNSTSYLTTSTAPGCGFDSSHTPTSPPDIGWWPATDAWGNQLNPSYAYQSVTMSGTHVTQSGWSNFHNAVLNATDYSAYQARTNATLPVYFFAVGLGGNSALGPPDPVLMQRMANDPNGDNYNVPPLYQPCAQETNCITYTAQPQGTFIFSASAASLSQAFLSISSQVLRLSK
jgi:Flp pilus assembly protein TadG